MTGAAAAVGGGPLAAALAATDPKALTATTREELGERPGLREELARLADPAVRRGSSDPSR
jgi:hypothetical protein